MRRKGGLLQHGTIPLEGDLTRICDVLRFPSDVLRAQQRARLRAQAATLAEVAGATLTWHKMANAIERGFSATFDLELASSQLSASEVERADELKRERFGNPDWTCKR
jgi:lipoate-protein ligase A